MEEKYQMAVSVLKLKALKVGDKFGQDQFDALHFILGDLFKQIPEPSIIGSAYFKNGTVLKTGILADATITEYEDDSTPEAKDEK